MKCSAQLLPQQAARAKRGESARGSLRRTALSRRTCFPHSVQTHPVMYPATRICARSFGELSQGLGELVQEQALGHHVVLFAVS